MIAVVYPRGGGGSWLNNLIWHLENADFLLPAVSVVFDNEPKSSIPFLHKFEIPDPSQSDQIVEYKLGERNVLFSNQYLFNHYLNNAIKVKQQFHNLDQLTPQQKLFELSNGAKYYFSNDYYKTCYCTDIELDYSLMFQAPKKFADALLEFLHSTNIKFVDNRPYILASIQHYRNTCPNPSDHFDNWHSMFWMGSCHAITILDQLPIDEIPASADLTTLAQILRPHAEHYKQRIAPLMFEWNYEYTT